ncbi:hypothetical protein FH972_021074 [Carpinus fangiana]|uniref:Uncharacterized protein n=1 Tax=Carpinus fangiana TaxID=176857 RepID=A0A5N6KNV1_9ROSI|nr:hypothetical protein FH972_021074 [Carpinus fangiana]
MYSRNDPRLRRTLNQISHNLESANESAQVGLFSVNEHYLKPCFASVSTCVSQCVGDCFPVHDERTRRARIRGRTQAEQSFDFYDDWEEDENAALLSWGNEEYERAEDTVQPKRRTFMDYGSRTDRMTPPARRRTLGERSDPTVIPSQSYFGFLRNLPFSVGKRVLRYKPSAEGLQDRPKGKTRAVPEDESIAELDEDDLSEAGKAQHGRTRSTTVTSGHTTDSFSSRGDIFPSDDEDAIPFDDEFDLGDAKSGSTPDDTSSGKKSTRPGNSRRTSRTTSSQSAHRPRKPRKNSSGRRSSGRSSIKSPIMSPTNMDQLPEIADLRLEEQRVQAEEEEAIERHREAAQTLARARGLSVDQTSRPSAPTTPASMLAMPNSSEDSRPPESSVK